MNLLNLYSKKLLILLSSIFRKNGTAAYHQIVKISLLLFKKSLYQALITWQIDVVLSLSPPLSLSHTESNELHVEGEFQVFANHDVSIHKFLVAQTKLKGTVYVTLCTISLLVKKKESGQCYCCYIHYIHNNLIL